MTADALAADPELGSYPLRCDQCGRILECTPADVRVFSAIGPPACCGEAMAFPAVPAIAAVSARPGRRRPARPGVVCQLRRRAQGPGPDLAHGLVDVSAHGLGVRLEAQLVPGDPVEVALSRPGMARPLVVPGQVRWCRPDAGGRYLAGVRLDRPLTAAEMDGLAR
jgi:hypothetical protein